MIDQKNGKSDIMPSAMEREKQMDFQEFLIAISNFGWELASSNTYRVKDEDEYEYFIFIQISERGDKGEFEKREFKVSELNTGLMAWFNDFI